MTKVASRETHEAKANPLDPGPRPRPRRKFGCKAILCTFLALLGLGACWIGYLLLRGFFIAARDPHVRLYQNLDVPYRPQDVVRPLVDANQTFDIVATVWLRTEAPETMVDTGENGGNRYRKSDEKSPVLHETAIFSDTVFRELHLKDKKKTSVNLQIPTEIFKKRDLNNYDLRASFVLVPTSPSPLDNATEYSDWRPTSAMYYPPVRLWPHDYRPLIAEEIIDSYGTFMPLIAFHNIQSICPNSTTSLREALDEEDEEDITEEQAEPEMNVPLLISQQRQKWKSTKGKSALAAHPYIITRSFLRVVDMTKILNKNTYDQFHNRIKSSSCGRYVTQQGYRTGPSWKDCVRSFVGTGSQEVRIRMARKSERTGKERTEWAYAPYLTLSSASWGPLDLVPIPVNREDCQHSASPEISAGQDRTSINVTWNIAFAGRSHLKLLTGVLNQSPEYNMTDSEANRLKAQADFELSQCLAGHLTRDDYHARRHFALTMIAFMLHVIDSLLVIHYWYTRSSTVGISISGTSLVAGATIAYSKLRAASDALKDEVTFKSVPFVFVYSFVIKVGWYMGALIMLKAITRAELHWRKRWMPVNHFSPPTHAERSSQRVDARATYRFKAIIFAAQAAVLYFVYHQQYFLIDPRGVGVPFESKAEQIISSLYSWTIYPAAINLGWMLQLILNYRMKIFAGVYAKAAYIKMARLTFDLMILSPWIIVLAFQAFTYPSVQWADEEEETK